MSAVRKRGRRCSAHLEIAGGPALDAAIGSQEAAGLSPAVESLVAVALASRQDVPDARHRTGDAERAWRVSRWNLLPQVEIDVSYTRRGLGSIGGAARADLFSG